MHVGHGRHVVMNERQLGQVLELYAGHGVHVVRVDLDRNHALYDLPDWHDALCNLKHSDLALDRAIMTSMP